MPPPPKKTKKSEPLGVCDDSSDEELEWPCEDDYTRAVSNPQDFARLCAIHAKIFEAWAQSMPSASASESNSEKTQELDSPSPEQLSHNGPSDVYSSNTPSNTDATQSSNTDPPDIDQSNKRPACFPSVQPSKRSCTDEQTGPQPSTSAYSTPPSPTENPQGGVQCGAGRVSKVTSEIASRQIPLFNAAEFRQDVDLRNIDLTDIGSVPERVYSTLTDLIARALGNATQDSVLNVELRGPAVDVPIQTMLNSGDGYNTDTFLEQVAQAMQSNDNSLTDDSLELIVTIARNMSGGGVGRRRKLGSIGYDQILSEKGNALYNPKNNAGNDNLCFSLCLAHYVNSRWSHDEKMNYAKHLHSDLGFDYTHKVSFSDVDRFQKHLKMKIVIFHHVAGCKKPTIFKTHDQPDVKTAWLYLHDEHYYLIVNKTAFFGASYVCDGCYKTYQNPLGHLCSWLCNVCYTDCIPDKTIKCTGCGRICKSQQCFENHKKPDVKHGLIPCNKIKYCESCHATYRVSKNPHSCKKPKCLHCREPLGATTHSCYIQPVERKESSDKYIFYDFETRYQCGRHEANFVCVMDMDGQKNCYETTNCVASFIKNYRQEKYRGYTFIAHNASGFDSYIVLEYLVSQKLCPTITMRGSRVLLMIDSTFNQRWIDSFSFIPMALSKTPAAMGFSDLLKGFFPHEFNKRENENYIGPYPAPALYGYDAMSDASKKTFMEWYVTVRDTPFDFRKELLSYCVNDVTVLIKACKIYREAFHECTGLDPFAYATLASSCMGVFKTLFLPKDSVALTYEGAYLRQNKTCSDVSIQWLEYVADREGLDIQHALNRGEKSFGQFFVDGYCEDTHTCYEFNGCFFHGCDKCYASGEINPLTKNKKKTQGELLSEFHNRVSALKNKHQLKVVVMWECDWRQAVDNDPDVKEFMLTYEKPGRLNPRESLFGGRTNAMKLYHKVENDEKIRYYDFTSLYPTVQSKRDYPIGHPQIIHKDFDDINKYFGIVKCTVAPPRGLYHPVLPYHCNGKLMFPLCAACAVEMNQTTPCTHSDQERLLSGVWVTFELQKAIEKGYKIVSIAEVWHFPEKTDQLFKAYVKTFLKRKQEASGYPGHIKTEDEKQKYIDDYYAHEGIRLDPTKICFNKAVRHTNKLLLNSLWGKFAMRSNMTTAELITEPSRFTQLMFSDTFDVRQFSFISPEVAIVQWRYTEGVASRVKDVNVFIGAMTTAYARMELYDLLDKLQERILYVDTDSILFTSRDGEWIPPLGPYLGDLTDELNSAQVCGAPTEDYITEFVSGGPKCYAYRTAQGNTQVKCKGVTLNATNAKVVTHESLIGLVQSFVTKQPQPPNHLTTTAFTITRDKKQFHLKNDTLTRKVQVVYNKRRVLQDYTTVPYGY